MIDLDASLDDFTLVLDKRYFPVVEPLPAASKQWLKYKLAVLAKPIDTCWHATIGSTGYRLQQ